MKIRKIGVILLIAFTVRLSLSCCDCPETNTFKYTFDSIQLFHLDNSGKKPVIVNSGTIPKEAYGMQIEFSLGPMASGSIPDLTLFNSACAYDCFCPPEFEYVAEDTISGMKIISLNDFDDTHPADSDISEYFKVHTGMVYRTFQEYTDHPENIYFDKPSREDIEILLMQPPTFTGQHQFRAEIELSDGTTLVATSTLISLE